MPRERSLNPVSFSGAYSSEFKRPSASRIFADITAGLEDLHEVAVEGQGSNVPQDLQIILARQLQAGLRSLKQDAARIVRRARATP